MPECYGMEDFKNGMEDNLPYFNTNSILDFLNGIYRKLYRLRIVITKNIKKRLATNHLSTNKWDNLVMNIAQTVQALHHHIILYVHCTLQLH